MLGHTMVCENLSLCLPHCGKGSLPGRNQLKYSSLSDSGGGLLTLTRGGGAALLWGRTLIPDPCPMALFARRLCLLLLPLALPFAGPAAAATCAVDIDAVEARIAALEGDYGMILSDISCDAPVIPAHILMCDAADAGQSLWRMGRLDDLAWVYAYENATGQQTDHENPPRDEAFIAARDACTDAACLCDALTRHTNDSLGGTSPYPQ